MSWTKAPSLCRSDRRFGRGCSSFAAIASSCRCAGGDPTLGNYCTCPSNMRCGEELIPDSYGLSNYCVY